MRAADLLPSAATSGRIDCVTPDCVTSSGTRTHGNRLCIENKCKKCYINATHAAQAQQHGRARCNIHSQPAVWGRHAPVAPSPSVDAPADGGSVIPDPPPAIAPSAPVAGPSSSQETVPQAPAHPPSQRAPSRRRGDMPLSQPCGPGWTKKRNEATDVRSAVLSQKQQNQEAEERRKRTCTLVIWYQVSVIPLLCMIHSNHYVGRLFASCHSTIRYFLSDSSAILRSNYHEALG